MAFLKLLLALSAFPFSKLVGAAAFAHGHNVYRRQSNSSATAQCDTNLCTWMHDTAEINTNTAVKAENVRQSRQYIVQVAVADTEFFSHSFVYESIPRNGNGNVMTPGDDPNSGTFNGADGDGISIEVDAQINMAWSQFEYSKDVDVKITRQDGQPTDADVVIRPTSIKYDVKNVGGATIIRVPADPNGRLFSVEFANDLFTYRSDGRDYTTNGQGDIVGIEPTNALLIFASPFLSNDMIPPLDGGNTKTMTPGPINPQDIGASPILYFPPGVYYVDTKPLGTAHLKLDPSTYWIHLAPGAYIKGAIEYTTGNQDFYATGHGVISGEIYVYQANADQGYKAIKDDVASLRLFWHRSIKGGQTWHCTGPTITSAPFNTMDLKDGSSDREDISVQISDYKQVGSFFMQTDGPQIYTNGNVQDIFLHVNDDAIKVYHSGVSVSRATVWKVHNDPIIQMGWTPRNAKGVTIDTLNIIHTRHRRSETVVPSAIIGASPNYDGSDKIDSSMSIDLTLSNVRCEGPCPALFRITPLQNYQNLVVKGVSFPDGLINGNIHTGDSMVGTTSDTPAGATNLKMGLQVSDWTVKGEKVTMENAKTLGQLSVNDAYSGQWSIS